jgi:hypothetical protein
MAEIELKIRKLKTGEALIACFESESDALTWLRERPSFVDVLGTADPDLDPEVSERLRQAMRPLDAEERAFIEEEERQVEAARRAAEAEAVAEAARKREERRKAAQSLGPNDPMVLSWTRDGGIINANPDDPREITATARRAFEEWIAERATWVSPPKALGEALVTVWPGDVPTGAESERIHPGGSFQTIFLDD